MALHAKGAAARVYRLVVRALSGRGLDRFPLVRRVDNAVLGLFRRREVTVDGHRLALDPLDSLHLSAFGAYEPLVAEFLEGEGRAGDVVADIGAHIGLHALACARRAGPGGKVYAFEPEPQNFALLSRNVLQNGYRNVVCERAAVGAVDGRATLYTSALDSADNRLFDAGGRRAVDVACVRPDTYFARAGASPRVIKMDVEGGEPAILGAMGALLDRPDLVIVTELRPDLIEAGGGDPAAFLAALTGRGFALSRFDERRGRLEPAEPAELLRLHPAARHTGVNLLCQRPGAAASAGG